MKLLENLNKKSCTDELHERVAQKVAQKVAWKIARTSCKIELHERVARTGLRTSCMKQNWKKKFCKEKKKFIEKKLLKKIMENREKIDGSTINFFIFFTKLFFTIFFSLQDHFLFQQLFFYNFFFFTKLFFQFCFIQLVRKELHLKVRKKWSPFIKKIKIKKTWNLCKQNSTLNHTAYF